MLKRLSSTSHVVAVSSMVAFATQVAFALLMLRWFTPQEVGEFSVISQIGFFWMTLALSQATLGLLTNQALPPLTAAQQAWYSSLWRGAGLLPIAAMSVWFSQLSLWPALLWVLLLALCQMSWMLAQSLTLRVGAAWAQAAVRVLPPLTAAISALSMAGLGAMLGWQGPTLVLSALLGYAVGALWLVPALTTKTEASQATDMTPTQADPRNVSLRMAHTLMDALLATAMVVVWQRLYGAQETGWMSALLRVLGFVPALVHMAWAQVALAHGQQPQDVNRPTWANPWWLGLTAVAGVIGLGMSCAVALDQAWLDTRWHGVWTYIFPLVLWQGAACLSAAFSHRPFQTQSASTYSWACMGLSTLQALVLVAPMWLIGPLDPIQHMTLLACVSGSGLLVLSVWMAQLKSRSTPK
jgi:uncharacterized membrane protein YqaE (UPF0057 family)